MMSIVVIVLNWAGVFFGFFLLLLLPLLFVLLLIRFSGFDFLFLDFRVLLLPFYSVPNPGVFSPDLANVCFCCGSSLLMSIILTLGKRKLLPV